VFSNVGLTASQGVTVSVVYGVMALFATLPGLVVLAVDALQRDRFTETAGVLAHE
jgi:hypothetical protein